MPAVIPFRESLEFYPERCVRGRLSGGEAVTLHSPLGNSLVEVPEIVACYGPLSQTSPLNRINVSFMAKIR